MTYRNQAELRCADVSQLDRLHGGHALGMHTNTKAATSDRVSLGGDETINQSQPRPCKNAQP